MAKKHKVTISELLVRRKELKTQESLRSQLDNPRFFQPRVTRKPAHEGIDQVDGALPKLVKAQVQQERDWFSHQWRLSDNAIQHANHTLEIEVSASVMKDWVTDMEAPEGAVTETLASLLTRRKHLDQRVQETYHDIEFDKMFHKFSTRKKADEGLEDLTSDVETITASAALAQQVYYVTQLRLCEVAIHKANTETKVEVSESVFQDFA